MSFLLNSRIALSVATLAAAGALVVGATFAYFSDTASSDNNSFVAGTMEININQDGIQTINPVISNWVPGQSVELRFDVQNSGNIPVNLRGFAAGAWVNGALDPTKVKVTKVEYFDSGWNIIDTEPSGFTGYFYYSSDGTVTGTLFELPAGATEEFRLTVELDASADNTYEAATFNATLSAEAKQTNDLVSWP